eukprot:scaffold7626_cov55-Phaeocystis_antarctica.AAC.6
MRGRHSLHDGRPPPARAAGHGPSMECRQHGRLQQGAAAGRGRPGFGAGRLPGRAPQPPHATTSRRSIPADAQRARYR